MPTIIRTVIVCLLSLFAISAHAQTSPLLESIKKEGVLRVGMADSPPSQSKNPGTDAWEGMNVDMAKNLAESLGVKLEIVDSTWATLIPGLLSNKYDLVMVDMFATPERAQTVVFTVPYGKLGYSFLVREDSPYKDWTDLNKPETTIATLSGTSGETFVKQRLPLAKMVPIVSDNNYAPHMEVMNGRADAHITDHVNNVLFMKNNPTAKLRTIPDGSGELLNATGLAYAMRPGDPHFQAFMNTWINYLSDSGQIAEWRLKWFGF